MALAWTLTLLGLALPDPPRVEYSWGGVTISPTAKVEIDGRSEHPCHVRPYMLPVAYVVQSGSNRTAVLEYLVLRTPTRLDIPDDDEEDDWSEE